MASPSLGLGVEILRAPPLTPRPHPNSVSFAKPLAPRSNSSCQDVVALRPKGSFGKSLEALKLWDERTRRNCRALLSTTTAAAMPWRWCLPWRRPVSIGMTRLPFNASLALAWRPAWRMGRPTVHRNCVSHVLRASHVDTDALRVEVLSEALPYIQRWCRVVITRRRRHGPRRPARCGIP